MNFTTIKGGFLVPEDSHIGKWQVETQRLDHDAWMREKLAPVVKTNMNVLDGGAFNGDHTIFYSEQVRPGIVVAVEAGGATYTALQHNVGLFVAGNVFPIRAALWSTELHTMEHVERENLGASYVREGGSLETLTVDRISRLFRVKFDFIKLDLEGCELHALIGAVGVIQDQRPILLLEINAHLLQAKGHSFSGIQDFLKTWGYKWEFLQPDVEEKSPQFDILCHPL